MSTNSQIPDERRSSNNNNIPPAPPLPVGSDVVINQSSPIQNILNIVEVLERNINNVHISDEKKNVPARNVGASVPTPITHPFSMRRTTINEKTDLPSLDQIEAQLQIIRANIAEQNGEVAALERMGDYFQVDITDGRSLTTFIASKERIPAQIRKKISEIYELLEEYQLRLPYYPVAARIYARVGTLDQNVRKKKRYLEVSTDERLEPIAAYGAYAIDRRRAGREIYDRENGRSKKKSKREVTSDDEN